MTSLLDNALQSVEAQPGNTMSRATEGRGVSAGTRIALQLQGDESLWHERIVLGHLVAASYVCLTPDLEIAVEELSFSNADIRGIRIGRPDGSFWGVDPGEFISFVSAGVELTDIDVGEWTSEAQRLITAMTPAPDREIGVEK